MFENYVNRTTFASYEDFKDNFVINVPENFNFAFDVVDIIAVDDPDRTALVWCNEADEEKIFSFADLSRASNRAANYMRELGIGKGDAVMLILKRRYEFWITFLALHKLGAIAIPATHLLTKKDITYRCNAADIKMIISVDDERVIASVENAEPDCPTLQRKIMLNTNRDGWLALDTVLDNYSDVFTRPSGSVGTSNDDIMLLYFTSGTTGLPKMVQHDYTYPLGHIITAGYWQCVQPGGLHLTVAETGWAKAVWGKIYGQWLCKSAVFVYDFDRFEPHKLMQKVEKYKLTTFCAPPTIFRFLIKEDLTKYDLSCLKYCVVAGEPMNPEIYNAFLKATGIRIMEGFGQTETVVAVATYPWLEPKPGSMGKPSPLYDIDLLNDRGESCEVGEEGQIVIHTASGKPVGMFNGYMRDDELTNSVWHDGIYYTGDMAWRDEDGYYWFVGRADDLIKTSGYRVGPFEVESALLEHPAVMECAITGSPDPVRGQVIKATVVLTKGHTAGPEMVHELQEHVKKVTAPYKYPRIIEFVTELPKTISGKIRRVQIRESDNEIQ